MADPRLERIARLLDLADRRMDDLERRRADRTRHDARVRRDRAAADPLAPRGTPRQAATEDRRERYAEDYPVADGMGSAYRDAQSRADSISRQFGGAASPPLAGERLLAYRKRLLAKFQKYSPAWRGVDLSRFSDDGLAVAESQIYADAEREATHPTHLRPGELVERVEIDDSGRRIRRFYGDPAGCWDVFKMPSRRVVGWGSGK